ncbi:MAG: leucine-rich repeat protein [Eubacteriales bacterium]|nr:leucine-rich repeat protein [Eubacteriales bacterium]
MKEKRNLLWKFLVGLCMMLALGLVPAETGQAAGRTLAETKKALGEYGAWAKPQEDWDEAEVMELLCPEKDLSEKKVFFYTNEIVQKLKGRAGDDYTKIVLEFPYTIEATLDFDGFSEKTDSLIELMFMAWGWYDSTWPMVKNQRRTECFSKDGDYGLRFSFEVNVPGENGRYRKYHKKLAEIVDAGKRKAGGDKQALMEYFFDWLSENVEIDEQYSGKEQQCSALLEGKINYEGFLEEVVMDLCNEAGIPVAKLYGEMYNWVEVFLYGKWYEISLSVSNGHSVTFSMSPAKKMEYKNPELVHTIKKVLEESVPLKTLTVTFKNGSKTVKTQKVTEGKAATAPKLSKKGYVLSWNTSFDRVVKNLTVKAVWTPEVPKKGSKATVDGLTYKVTKSAKKNGTVQVVGVSSKSLTKYTIPATVKIGKTTFKVTSIGANAFKNCKKAKSFTLPKTITAIGKNAFKGTASKVVVNVPKAQYTKLSKLLWKAGLNKKAVIKKK